MRVFDVTIAFPWALLLLLLAPFIIVLSRKSLAHMPLWQKAASTAWRLLVLLAFTAILSNPSIRRKTSRICVAAIIDVSDSIPRDSFARTSELLGRLEKKKPAGATFKSFVFAGKIMPLKKEQSGSLHAADPDRIEGRRTDIPGALFHALSLLPQDCSRRIVAVTDGRDTENDLTKLPWTLARAAVKIFPVEPGGTKVSEVILEEMMVPPVVKTESPFNARVIAFSSDRVGATVRLWDSLEGGTGPQLVEEREVTLEEGISTLTFTVKVKEEGKHLLRAEASSPSIKELFTQNNAFESAFLAQGPNKVLYVEGEPARGSHLRSALTNAGYKVQMEGASYLAKGSLDDFDAVFLSDLPYHGLPGGAFGKIKAYAASGGVFVFSGGKQSYSMGGYRGSPFEPYLPVSMEIEKEVQKVSTAVILVLDKSGSMSGMPVQMAKEAAKASVSVLDPEVQVEVISFDSAAKRLFHMQSAKNKMMIDSFISQIYAGGGTNIISALQVAYSDLVPVQAKKKHIVLLTDGQSSQAGIESLLSKASGSNITISTIGLGGSVDRGFLEKIAVETGGKSYFTSNPKALPRLFMQEMRVVTPPAVVEGVIDVKVKKYLPFIGKVGGSLPYLRGYNLTSAKGGRAVTSLVSDRGDPILALWKQGKGWVVAFTSDVKTRWGAPWAGWSLFGKFWAEMIRFLSGKEKKEEEKGGKINVTVEGRKVTVTEDLIDEASGEFIDGASGSGCSARFNEKSESAFALSQTAPGHYEGQFFIKDYGAYFIKTELRSAIGLTEKANTSLNIPYPPEYRKMGTDREMLKEIARKTSGRLDAPIREIWSPAGSDIETTRPLWPFLVLLLLILLPLDIAIRRLPF